jgi:putative membrane protein insertion efficiency factor
MVRLDILRTMVWDMGHFLKTSFSGISDCILKTSFCGIAMILGELSLLMLGLWFAYKTGRTFKWLGGMLDLSRSARCSAMVFSDVWPAYSRSPLSVTRSEHNASAFVHTDEETLPDVDIKESVWTGLWTSKPLVRAGTSRIIYFLQAILSSVFIAGIMLYQGILRPSMVGSCRFYPTCSVYAIDAFHQHGLMTAIVLIVWRIIRCNPWGKCGYDPVPSSLFSSS